jgi:hypothetical protein
MLAWIACSAAAAIAEPLSNDQDHLQPIGWEDKRNDQYRHLLESKLGVTPFDCGRAIVELPFEGELSVSVYSSSQENRQPRYFVTYVKAEHNLWQRTGMLKHPDAARSVKAMRHDAEIPDTTAKFVKDVWVRMLKDVRRDPRSSKPYMVGGEYVIGGLGREFSIQQSHHSRLNGWLFRSPAPGTKTEALVKLTDMLIDYSEAFPADRPAIGDKIHREAKSLLTRLK